VAGFITFLIYSVRFWSVNDNWACYSYFIGVGIDSIIIGEAQADGGCYVSIAPPFRYNLFAAVTSYGFLRACDAPIKGFWDSPGSATPVGADVGTTLDDRFAWLSLSLLSALYIAPVYPLKKSWSSFKSSTFFDFMWRFG
jgi:hypothetical protein